MDTFDLSFYKGKKVFVTGHTGFKGSWLCKILANAGAVVTGYSLTPPTSPSLFEIAGIEQDVNSVIGDIRDYKALKTAFDEAQPEIVLHLAAQPIVRDSYKDPAYTYETNVMGTVNILECVRNNSCVKSFLNVTTDKVYLNKEWAWGYRENEELDGYDPYSNSKSCDYIKLCAEVGCKRVVYASSINEMETYEYLQSDDIEPAGGYIYGTGKLAAHLMGETVAKLNGVDFIPVIITNIYGVGEKSARMIYTSINKLVHKEHCSFTAGYQTYDFIYITDAINSIVAVAEKGKAFNRYYIGSGEPKPLREFLLEMRDIVDPTAEIGLGDIPFKGVDISYSQFDLKKVERDTGYINQIPFAEGIKMTADYIRGEK